MTNDLGNFLRKVRKARNLKLRQVAVAINKSPQYVCDLEKGKRGKNLNPLLAVKLAEFLNISIVSIMTRAGIEINEDDLKYKEYLKLTRNKIQSQRLFDTFEALYDSVNNLKSLTEPGSNIKKIVHKLSDLIHEMDIALRKG